MTSVQTGHYKHIKVFIKQGIDNGKVVWDSANDANGSQGSLNTGIVYFHENVALNVPNVVIERHGTQSSCSSIQLDIDFYNINGSLHVGVITHYMQIYIPP